MGPQSTIFRKHYIRWNSRLISVPVTSYVIIIVQFVVKFSNLFKNAYIVYKVADLESI